MAKRSVRAMSVGETPPGGGDRHIHTAINGFRHVVRVLRVSAREAEDTVGLSAAQLYVLSRLAGAPSLSLNEVAAATLTHQSSASAVVARLVVRGLVRRGKAPDDARRLVLAITPAGRTLLARAPGVAQDALIDALSRLPALRRRQLAVALTELVPLLGDTTYPPPYFFEDAPSDAAGSLRGKRRRVGK